MGYEIEIKEGLLSTKVFSIDEQNLTYHDTQMEIKDITGFRYGVTSHRINGVETRIEYRIGYQDNSGDEIEIAFNDGMFRINDAQEKFNAIIHFTWEYFGNRILNEFISAVANGKDVAIGKMTFNQSGVQFPHKPFFGKERIQSIAWNHIRHDVANAMLNFKSAIDSDINRSLSAAHNYNIMVLNEVFKLARTNREVLESLMGQKLPKSNRR